MLLALVSNLLADSRYAFVYSKNIDDKFINSYDKVIVEADEVDNIYALRYPKKMVAYVSVGEIEPWRDAGYNRAWVISKNRTWNSLIADLREEEYQKFLFQRVERLYKMGYRNFFLDTLDSYHVTYQDKELFQELQTSLISFIHELRKRYPNSKIIINRGFEILDRIHKDVDGVVAESLISGYNHTKKSYYEIPKGDREWILNRLLEAKKYGLDVVSIDYSDGDSKKRRDIAERIRCLGVIPYVTDGLLMGQGESGARCKH